jgi:hypothetical protein
MLAAELPDLEVEVMVEVEARKLTVVRVALAGAVAAMAFYFLCWLGGFVPIGPATHLYLQLFTTAEPTSVLALAQGLCWSLVFGLIAGGLFGLAYNAFAALDGRRIR